jgi:hypothetical protein
VLFHFELPHLKLNRIGGVRVRWRRRDIQLEVPNSLRELSGVLGVLGPADIIDNFLGRLDELIGASIPGRVVDKTFQ